MDPEALLREIVEKLAHDEFAEALLDIADLKSWRSRGGFAVRRPEVRFGV